jgi:hypothetical protein
MKMVEKMIMRRDKEIIMVGLGRGGGRSCIKLVIMVGLGSFC